MNVEIGYDEAMMPTMLCDPAKSTATKIGNLNGNRGLHMYVYIYIHMHNVHNKSAPCLFQIVTAFSKSAKHFGKERKKQHINNIHYEGPPHSSSFAIEKHGRHKSLSLALQQTRPQWWIFI